MIFFQKEWFKNYHFHLTIVSSDQGFLKWAMTEIQGTMSCKRAISQNFKFTLNILELLIKSKKKY